MLVKGVGLRLGTLDPGKLLCVDSKGEGSKEQPGLRHYFCTQSHLTPTQTCDLFRHRNGGSEKRSRLLGVTEPLSDRGTGFSPCLVPPVLPESMLT